MPFWGSLYRSGLLRPCSGVSNLSEPLGRIADDPDVFEAFYRDHVDAVQRFVARRLDDPHMVADMTGEVFLAAIDGAHGCTPSCVHDSRTAGDDDVVTRRSHDVRTHADDCGFPTVADHGHVRGYGRSQRSQHRSSSENKSRITPMRTKTIPPFV